MRKVTRDEKSEINELDYSDSQLVRQSDLTLIGPEPQIRASGSNNKTIESFSSKSDSVYFIYRYINVTRIHCQSHYCHGRRSSSR